MSVELQYMQKQRTIAEAFQDLKIDISLPIYYAKGYKYISDSRSTLEDVTGYRLPHLPTLSIRGYSNVSAAQLYEGILLVYGKKHVTSEIIHHEVFHEAERLYRAEKAKTKTDNSETEFLGKYHAMVLGTQASDFETESRVLSRASTIWNSINEAGAYLFGYYSKFRNDGDKETAILRTFETFQKDREINLHYSISSFLNYWFNPNAKEDIGLISNAPAAINRTVLALPISALVVEISSWQISKALNTFLDEPPNVFATIRNLTAEDVRKRLTSFEERLLYVASKPYKDVLR